MKILLLSDCNSVHTIKWATSLAEKKLQVVVFSLGCLKVKDYELTSVKIIAVGNKISRDGLKDKLQYLRALPKLKKTIEIEKPNIVHAHYATSYGLLGALSRFHPFVLSVWGSDVFDFPQKSKIHRLLVKYNLKKADKILSTSQVMAKETRLYTNKEIEVTPFGIDMEAFKPREVNKLFKAEDIVIGTIKTLEEKYGIRYLIDAFKVLVDKYPELPLKLLLVGGGSLENKIRDKIKNLGIENTVKLTGNVPFEEVVRYHNMIDIYVALSVLDSESFGVAIVEASACETPVVVSKVGGLPEVVEDGITGIVVPKENVEKAAEAIEKLLLNKTLREQMGKAGRERVKKFYNWKDNVIQMIDIYNKVLK